MLIMRAMIAVGLLAGIAAVIAPCKSALAGDASCLGETPLPASFKTDEPPVGVAADISRFVGMWGGARWDGNLCHTLVVRAVDADGNAEVIYSFGKYLPWNIRQANFFAPKGKIKDGVLRLSGFGNGADVSYKFSNGQLLGSYLLKGNTSHITLDKIER